MGDIVTQAAVVYRDKVSPGSNVNHEPVKSEIRALFGTVETATNAASSVAAYGVKWTPNIVRVRSTGNVAIATALENGDTLNGVTLATGNFVFLGSQTAPAENGIYLVNASGAATRATFADTAAELAHIGFVIREGTVGAGERWTLPMEAADITLGSTALTFALIGIEVSYADAIDQRLDLLEAQGVVVGSIAGASTASAIVLDPRVGSVAAYSNGQLYAFSPSVANNANPTLAIGTGPAKPLYTPAGAPLPAGYLPANRPVLTMYESASGGFFRLIYSAENPYYRIADVSGGTGDAIVAVSTGQTALPYYSGQTAVLVRLASDVTVATPTLALDGLAALPIYGPLAELVDRRLLRAGTYVTLRYSPAFGGLWHLVDTAAPVYSAGALEGLQRADESASGVRALREELLAASVLTPVALNPVPIYSNTFSGVGSETGFTTAKGIGPSDTPTYATLTRNAGGAYIESSAVATSGAGSWWWDWNHVGWGPGFLQLLAVFNAAAVSSGPLPNIPDLRNIRVTLELEAVDLYLPYMARLMFHWQGVDLDVANGGTGKTVNFHWHEPLDNFLGGDGLGKGAPPEPNSGSGRILNGSATIDIDFVPNDAYWRCIGTSENRAETYAFAPVERVMQAGGVTSFLNMQIQIVHPQQYGAPEGASKPPVERAYGALRLKSVVIQEPV